MVKELLSSAELDRLTHLLEGEVLVQTEAGYWTTPELASSFDDEVLNLMGDMCWFSELSWQGSWCGDVDHVMWDLMTSGDEKAYADWAEYTRENAIYSDNPVQECEEILERCAATAKKINGWNTFDGYVPMHEWLIKHADWKVEQEAEAARWRQARAPQVGGVALEIEN